MTPVRNVAQFTTGPYRIAEYQVDAHAMATNKTPSGTYRGPGRYEGCFFMDRLLDMAAHDLGLDPARHPPTQSRRASTTCPIRWPPSCRTMASATLSCDSGDYSATLRPLPSPRRAGGEAQAARQADRRPLSRPRARLLHRGRRLRPARERAHRASRRTARSRSMSARPRSGRGSRPSSRRSPPTRWRSRRSASRSCHGSTNYLKEGFGSYGSRATVMGGNASWSRPNDLLAKFRSAAAQHLGVPEDALNIAEGAAQRARRQAGHARGLADPS